MIFYHSWAFSILGFVSSFRKFLHQYKVTSDQCREWFIDVIARSGRRLQVNKFIGDSEVMGCLLFYLSGLNKVAFVTNEDYSDVGLSVLL
jgi:hypothetical protein